MTLVLIGLALVALVIGWQALKAPWPPPPTRVSDRWLRDHWYLDGKS